MSCERRESIKSRRSLVFTRPPIARTKDGSGIRTKIEMEIKNNKFEIEKYES